MKETVTIGDTTLLVDRIEGWTSQAERCTIPAGYVIGCDGSYYTTMHAVFVDRPVRFDRCMRKASE
jgi:hypothetical protein